MRFRVRKSPSPYEWFPWRVERITSLGRCERVRSFLTHGEAFTYLDDRRSAYRRRFEPTL